MSWLGINTTNATGDNLIILTREGAYSAPNIEWFSHIIYTCSYIKERS